MSKLTIHENERSTVYEILEDSLVIGTRQGCAVRLSDPEVDGDHCQITLLPGVGYKLIDLESRQGTKINGAFVNQHLLREGDVIQIGQVRISFTGAAPAAAAPAAAIPAPPARAIPASPAPARPAARPARPAPAGARHQYAGYPSAPPREYRAPRRGRGDSSGPIIMMGAAVGLLLLIVVIIVIVNASSSLSPNEKIYLEMQQLIDAHQYDGALTRAEQADPNGDQKFLAKIELQIQAVKSLKAQQGGITGVYKSLHAYQQVESWIQKHRHDIAGTISQWEALIRDHPGTLYATKAKANIDHLLGGGQNPEGITKYPGGRATIDRSFAIAQTTSRSFENEDRYQQAIDAFFDFWEEYKLHATDISTWEKRIQDEVKKIESHAESRWETLDGVAKQYVNNGEYGAAIRLYRKVAERFGIEKFQYRAGEAMRKLQRD